MTNLIFFFFSNFTKLSSNFFSNFFSFFSKFLENPGKKRIKFEENLKEARGNFEKIVYASITLSLVVKIIYLRSSCLNSRAKNSIKKRKKMNSQSITINLIDIIALRKQYALKYEKSIGKISILVTF